MKPEIRDDFIGVFNQAYTQKQCDDYIRFFKNAEKAGMVVNRQASENVSPFTKNDLSTTANGTHLTQFMLDKYPELDEVYMHSNEFSKVLMDQALKEYCRAIPGQGYHVWHHEHGTGGRAHRRLLAFSLYLNTVDEGGETEFLYQKVRFKPVVGQLLIWPAYFTHAHRGNQPLSGEKYIVTGWIEK